MLSVPWGILSYMNIAGGSIRKTVTILGIDTVVGYSDPMKAPVQQCPSRHYSTVTDLARFLGQSTLQPL